ncbi:DUF5712 family protein [Zobellia laminariae]|uniref:DUF5712 family protein n=1 Tax=Zobellia laminariae TaxID=248906 RepID=UPI003EF5373A
MPISKPHSTLGSKNNGSCSTLVIYLDKENREFEKMICNKNDIQEVIFLNNMKQDFFNHSRTGISVVEVIDTIDSNIKKLGKSDAKYFAPTINFSHAEQKHIIHLATGKDDIDNVLKLNAKEFKRYNSLLKGYTRLVMNNYAKNFNRENKGLNSGENLVYFGKIEHFRKFKGTDNAVKEGVVKNGDYKPGLNSHAHIVVSRKDITQRLKLTPTTKERSTQRTIGGNNYQVGFDRMKWINKNEIDFDLYFNYKRTPLEKFKNQYLLKNGSPKQKDELLKKIKQIESSNRKIERGYIVQNNTNLKL